MELTVRKKCPYSELFWSAFLNAEKWGPEWLRIRTLFAKCKFVRDQVASKNPYFHEEIKYLRQQLETALSKQENSNIGFCNNRHGQHIRSNIVCFDDSIILTDYQTKATGNETNIQAYSYINNENTDNIITSPSTENSQKDRILQHQRRLSMKKKYL